MRFGERSERMWLRIEKYPIQYALILEDTDMEGTI